MSTPASSTDPPAESTTTDPPAETTTTDAPTNEAPVGDETAAKAADAPKQEENKDPEAGNEDEAAVEEEEVEEEDRAAVVGDKFYHTYDEDRTGEVRQGKDKKNFFGVLWDGESTIVNVKEKYLKPTTKLGEGVLTFRFDTSYAPLGMRINMSTVEKVYDQGQAIKLGVKVGWKIINVGGRGVTDQTCLHFLKICKMNSAVGSFGITFSGVSADDVTHVKKLRAERAKKRRKMKNQNRRQQSVVFQGPSSFDAQEFENKYTQKKGHVKQVSKSWAAVKYDEEGQTVYVRTADMKPSGRARNAVKDGDPSGADPQAGAPEQKAPVPAAAAPAKVEKTEEVGL